MVKFSFPKLLLQKKKTNLAILSMVLRYTQVMHKILKENYLYLIQFHLQHQCFTFHHYELSVRMQSCTAFQMLNSLSSHCKQVHFPTTAVFRIFFCPSFWPWDLEVSSFLLVLTVSLKWLNSVYLKYCIIVLIILLILVI